MRVKNAWFHAVVGGISLQLIHLEEPWERAEPIHQSEAHTSAIVNCFQALLFFLSLKKKIFLIHKMH